MLTLAQQLVLEGCNFLRMSDPDSVLCNTCNKTLPSDRLLVIAFGTCTFFLVVGQREPPHSWRDVPCQALPRPTVPTSVDLNGSPEARDYLPVFPLGSSPWLS